MRLLIQYLERLTPIDLSDNYQFGQLYAFVCEQLEVHPSQILFMLYKKYLIGHQITFTQSLRELQVADHDLIYVVGHHFPIGNALETDTYSKYLQWVNQSGHLFNFNRAPNSQTFQVRQDDSSYISSGEQELGPEYFSAPYPSVHWPNPTQWPTNRRSRQPSSSSTLSISQMPIYDTQTHNLFSNILSQMTSQLTQSGLMTASFQMHWPDELDQNFMDPHPVHLSGEQFNLIKPQKFSELKMEQDNDRKSCPITHKTFEQNDQVSVLPCNHVFEYSAIKEWLTNRSVHCPVCRTDLREHLNAPEETTPPK
jgi:hypothetical protein